MQEYRTEIEADPDARYTYVEMGPVPELPPWHEQSQPSRFPFPTEGAAFRFGEAHKAECRDREVTVVTTDGKRFVL